MLLSRICMSTTTNRDRRDVNEGRKESKEKKGGNERKTKKETKQERKREKGNWTQKRWKSENWSCSQKGQADCLCPNMLAFSKLTWQRRYFPHTSWIKEASIVHLWKQSNLPPCELHSLYWYSTLPHGADIFSNYVINTMAGRILEKVHYNCIQSFIS